MRGQLVTCRYRGDKVTITYLGGRNMRVWVSDWRGVTYYQTSAPNLGQALAYAQNAVAYHLDGVATWPGGVPLVVPSTLPQTKARRAACPPRYPVARLPTRGFIDGRVRDYLDQKQEDY